MIRVLVLITIYLMFPVFSINAESFRTIIESTIEVSPERPQGSSASIGINSSILITLGQEARFLRGVEITVSAPQNWIPYRNALVTAAYNNLTPKTGSGVVDIDGTRIAFEPLPARLQTIYQIPVRQNHGLRTTTSVTVPAGITLPNTFPILFGFVPAIKGLSSELETMRFNITVRPILSDEGAVRLSFRYPAQLRNRPFTVRINDTVITNINEQIVLKEGENHIVILSDDYRNESRRFVVERAKVIDLTIELQDPTPIIIFEAPQNALIYLNNTQIPRNRESVTVEPGTHEVRFQVGDYTVTRSVNVQRGKTYRIAMAVDVTVQEED